MEPTKVTIFDYTTKHLTDRNAILEKCDHKEIDQLLSALEEGNWFLPIFEKRSYLPSLALRCFHDQKIKTEQFATLMIYWAVLRHHPHRDILPCDFERNHLLVKQTFAVPEKIDKKYQNHYHKEPYLSSEQELEFISLMKEAPKSERSFFLIPDFQHKDGEKYSITQAIAYNLGINVFNRVVVDGKTMRMIPSFTMMQAFLKAFVGKTYAVDMYPGLGLWLLEDIRQDNVDGRRVLGLPFPGITLPDEADGYRCPQDYDFIHHDFYHAIILSLILPQHRKAFMAIEKVVSVFQNETKNETQKMYSSELSERLIDLELPTYRRETCRDLKQRFKANYTTDLIFWDSLRDLILQTLEKIYERELNRQLELYPKPKAKLLARQLITQLQWEDNPIPEIAQKIFDSVNFADFGIDINSLEQYKSYVVEEITWELTSKNPKLPLEPRMTMAKKRDIILQLYDVKKKQSSSRIRTTKTHITSHDNLVSIFPVSSPQ